MSNWNFESKKLLGNGSIPEIIYVKGGATDVSVKWSLTHLDSVHGFNTRIAATLSGNDAATPVLIQQAMYATAPDAEWVTIDTLSYTDADTYILSETLPATGSTIMPYIRIKFTPVAGTNITVTDVRRTVRGLA